MVAGRDLWRTFPSMWQQSIRERRVWRFETFVRDHPRHPLPDVVTWEAADPNGDPLVYDLYLRTTQRGDMYIQAVVGVTAVPLTPAGIGFVEGGIVGLLTIVYGVPETDALAITLVDRAISVLSIIIIGSIAYAVSSKRRASVRSRFPALKRARSDPLRPVPTARPVRSRFSTSSKRTKASNIICSTVPNSSFISPSLRWWRGC